MHNTIIRHLNNFENRKKQSPFVCVLIATLVLAFNLTGCASYSVYRVENNEKVGPKGIRFYMPRPYVSVYEPFAVSAEGILAQGTVSADGQYLRLEPSAELAGLGLAVTAGEGSRAGSVTVPLNTRIVVSGRQGEPEGDTTGASSRLNALKDKEKPGQSGEGKEGQDSEKDKDSSDRRPKSGQQEIRVANDNGAFAVTPQRRFFDILWLPDFNEQYVVDVSQGLGNSKVAIALGQGWSLQGVDATFDNSAITDPLIDLYASSLKLLQQYARTQIGLPPTLGLSGAPEGAVAGKAERPAAGTPVTAKIHVVEMVAPGIYPILKPNEVSGANSPPEVAAFKTYKVITIEAAVPRGDSPLNLLRYKDLETPPIQSIETGPASPRASGISQTKLNKVRDDLNGVYKKDKKPWEIIEIKLGEDGLYIVNFKVTETGKEEEAKKCIQDDIAQKLSIEDKNKISLMKIG